MGEQMNIQVSQELFKALQTPGGYAAAAELLRSRVIDFGGVRWNDTVSTYYVEDSRPDIFEKAAVKYLTIPLSDLEVMPNVRVKKEDFDKWNEEVSLGNVIPAIVATPFGFGKNGGRLVLDGHHRRSVVEKTTRATHVRIAEVSLNKGWRLEVKLGKVGRRTVVSLVEEEA
jgi:hypothetical protein